MAKRGPSLGHRILVKLPFGKDKTGGGKHASTRISIKYGVAEVLGFEQEKDVPTKSVKFKTAKGEATTVRRVRGSYRRQSVKLIFNKPKTIKGSKGTFKTVSMPVPTGVTLDDIEKYFYTGAGKSKGVVGMVTPQGVSIYWGKVG